MKTREDFELEYDVTGKVTREDLNLDATSNFDLEEGEEDE